jgi:hypothetical protein
MDEPRSDEVLPRPNFQAVAAFRICLGLCLDGGFVLRGLSGSPREDAHPDSCLSAGSTDYACDDTDFLRWNPRSLKHEYQDEAQGFHVDAT